MVAAAGDAGPTAADPMLVQQGAATVAVITAGECLPSTLDTAVDVFATLVQYSYDGVSVAPGAADALPACDVLSFAIGTTTTPTVRPLPQVCGL